MPKRLALTGVSLGIALVVVGCGGGEASKAGNAVSASTTAQGTKVVDVCSLLTPAEIAAVTGAKVGEIKPDTQGTVGTCNYQAGTQLMPVVTLVLAPSMPKVSSSAEMAAWRSKQGTVFGDLKIIITPIEGLGVPAIRNEVEGMGLVTVEAAAKGMMLGVATSSLERSKALAVKALARL
jgi:hypothetical protein